MSNPTHDLDRIQAWFQSVIMHSGGVEPGMRTDAARACIDIGPAEIEAVVLPSRHQTSVERLEIYARAYFARLLECMRAEYPVMVAALGEELFDQFAIAYLEEHPSRSYTLDHLGARFPEFLAETRPGDAQGDNSWLDFLVDLARLEWSIAEVFDGPGAENSPLLDKDRILAIPPEHWFDIRLVPVPCLRVVRLDFPVQDYYRALRTRQDANPPERAETFLAITRRNYVVRHFPLSPPEAHVLTAIVVGATVGEAISELPLESEADMAELAAQLRDWFRRWSAEGLFLDATLAATA